MYGNPKPFKRRKGSQDIAWELCGSNVLELCATGTRVTLYRDDYWATQTSSVDSLMVWHGAEDVTIDRYDVRHFLYDLTGTQGRDDSAMDVAESDLDFERYKDLDGLGENEDSDRLPTEAGPSQHRAHAKYGQVPLIYTDVSNSTGDCDKTLPQKSEIDQMEGTKESSGDEFRPHFPIPGDLKGNLPATGEVNLIILRTAKFVRNHGGQSEVLLRMKQAGNPKFSFLIPGDRLHAYFQFLVTHHEIGEQPDLGDYQAEASRLTIPESKNTTPASPPNAVLLLGTTYGDSDEES